MFANEQVRAATLRGVYLAVGTFLASLLTALQQGLDIEQAAISGGIAALFVLGFRGGIEGSYDAHRAETRQVHKADVGSDLPPIR